jgi:hypothetical protein
LNAVRKFDDTLHHIPVSAHAADGTRRTIIVQPTGSMPPDCGIEAYWPLAVADSQDSTYRRCGKRDTITYVQ